MLRLITFGMVVLAFVGGTPAQTPGCCGFGTSLITEGPLVEVRGRITEVRISPGKGMPSLVVKNDAEVSVIFLGSIRYLITQDFTPKAGEEVVAKAYKTSSGLFAASVTLPQTKKTIRLRDEAGRPLWRGSNW